LDQEAIIDREIASIKQPYLWCSSYENLNDPMEGVFRPSTRLKGLKGFKAFEEKFKETKENVGIACFSDSRRNQMMWSHYAGNHSGICIGFKTTDLVNGLPDSCSLVRLAYDDRRPRLSSKVDIDRGAAVMAFSQKKLGWAYEREWRVLAVKSPTEPAGTIVPIDTECVTHVYFGFQIKQIHRVMLLKALDDTGIKISDMVVSSSGLTAKRIE